MPAPPRTAPSVEPPLLSFGVNRRVSAWPPPPLPECCAVSQYSVADASSLLPLQRPMCSRYSGSYVTLVNLATTSSSRASSQLLPV